MSPKLYFPIILLLYLCSAYFIKEYVSLGNILQDEAQIETGIIGQENNYAATGTPGELDVIKDEDKNLRLQSYGYLAGGAFFIVCPTLLFIYRRKFLN